MQSSSVTITELIRPIRNAYSDTAAVTSCSRIE